MPPRIGPRRPARVYLAEHRKAAGLTQQQVGDRFDPPVDKGTISRLENAKPGEPKITLGAIAAYAEALNRPVSDMYRLPDEGPSLDALASGLDKEDREALAATITRMTHRRAS